MTIFMPNTWQVLMALFRSCEDSGVNKWEKVATLLLVGEGATEVAFLNHVKATYVARGAGLRVTVKNAHGKGAKHVIEWTIRQIGDFDLKAALLDTDQDWTAAVAKRAKSAKVKVLTSEPQVEAMLLRMLGQSDSGDPQTLKTRLAPFVRNQALVAENYADRFDRACLEAARLREATLDELLRLLEKPPQVKPAKRKVTRDS